MSIAAGPLTNLVALKIGWILAVLGAAHEVGWAGPAWALLVVTVYLFTTEDRRSETRLLVLVCIAGTALDSLVMNSGMIRFAAPGPFPYLAPLWIIGLWALMATSLTRSLRWLRDRPLAASAAGAVIAPLSYWAGESLGAAVFVTDPRIVMTVYAIAWGAVLPLLCMAAASQVSPGRQSSTYEAATRMDSRHGQVNGAP